MRNYPQEIEDQAIALTRLTSERDAAQRELEFITDGITRAVLADVDETTGKPRYSNDKARELAIRERCRLSVAWTEADERLRLAELARAGSQARLERLRGEFSESKLARRERIVNMEAAIN
jgi:hypothetical protein